YGVAVPHARIDGLADPVVAVGLSKEGIDFDAPDGVPAKIVFLLLTPLHDDGAQLEILADIAKIFNETATLEKSIQVSTYTEFLAFFKTKSS
ncbi:PTS sugar transporter subunit IIA, partial [Candidatus Poribacteria bacterium]|nr:PTS sugar transporter subunit IIA [Candidatus Poribacteria bacterium]